MSLFEESDYKRVVTALLERRPKRGHGEFRRIAMHLGVHTTLISQIFRGGKDLTFEQAARLAEYLGLSDLESDYFLSLVERARAGDVSLKRMIDRRIARLRKRAAEVGERLPEAHQLSDAERGIFYSRWIYSAVRIAPSVSGLGNVDAIADALRLPRGQVAEVLEFLLSHGLCVRDQTGRLQVGPQRVHVGSDSPFVLAHHRNWRSQALAAYESRFSKAGGPRSGSDDLLFTSPLTISGQDFAQVRELLLELIEKVSTVVKATEPDQVACLNLDWVRITS